MKFVEDHIGYVMIFGSVESCDSKKKAISKQEIYKNSCSAYYETGLEKMHSIRMLMTDSGRRYHNYQSNARFNLTKK